MLTQQNRAPTKEYHSTTAA